ncbi:hypothetical protein OBBRIDRAFT_792501 [Obba rivulosa]|uniref:Uncharacterized protein n=1 Tax=Obba rivulosa TaxID=1052685 RepID=A0A8E2B2W3_9APHY|nr:hypothetical protein OBBRIDRAFT_792501 [Obba rivulosa]
MATYYVPPRQRASLSRTDTSSDEEHRPERVGELSSLTLDVGDHPIYVFPNPPSMPPSPGSSLFSAPSDFPSSPSTSSLGSTRSRRRVRHASTSSIPTDMSRSRSREDSSANSDIFLESGSSSFSHVSRTLHLASDAIREGDDIEVWDWTADSGRESTDGSWALEEEVERAGQWDVQLYLHQLPQRTAALGTSTARRHSHATLEHARYYLYRAGTRTRTQSGASSTSLREVPRRVLAAATPQPRIHIPFLSTFAKLLFIDHDDPVLRLLTQAGTEDEESILFPGHSAAYILSSDNQLAERDSCADTDESAGRDGEEDSDPSTSSSEHGLAKLFSPSSEPSGLAIWSLRTGLKAPLPVDFGVPSVCGLVGFWRAVGEVCVRGGQAWREVWR